MSHTAASFAAESGGSGWFLVFILILAVAWGIYRTSPKREIEARLAYALSQIDQLQARWDETEAGLSNRERWDLSGRLIYWNFEYERAKGGLPQLTPREMWEVPDESHWEMKRLLEESGAREWLEEWLNEPPPERS